MGNLRLALCQLDAVVGDLEGNTAQVLAALAEAEAAGAELALFPELMLTGYPPEDLLLEPSFVEGSRLAVGRVAAASAHCAAVVGFVDSGHDLYNAAAVCCGGKVHGIWHKEELPNYGVFDERRWFTPGSGATPLFSIGGVVVGVTICEDAWSPLGPVARQAAGGAELVVSLNASPYRRGVLAERERMLATRAADASCALAYVNLVGGQDELVFDGASMVFDLNGTRIACGPQFEEAIVLVDLEVQSTFRKRILEPRGRHVGPSLPVVVVTERSSRPEVPLRPNAPRLDPVAEVYEALVLSTADYVKKNGFSDVVVGLSGGVDSALVATIAADALGAEHVHGVLLPSRFSSVGSLDDAEKLAVNLGIDWSVVPIESVHAAYLELLTPHFAGRSPDLTEENLQARIRGTVLMALSNKFGWLLLTTGNKSEMAVGYATLYGDMAGGFAVIKDVPKMLVYELCDYRNGRAGSDLVPKAILVKAPSAELRPDQRDEDSLPPYELLDPIIEGYVEQDLGVAELVALGHEEATVRRVIDLVDKAEYKRRQAPPGARVTSRAFGKDRRMPITSAYRARARRLALQAVSEPLSLAESADLLGRYRFVELECFAQLGERAARCERPEVARYLSGAARAHAWRAGLLEALLPVSVGLPAAAELTVSPHPALGSALQELVAAEDDSLVEGLLTVLYPAMLAAYRAHLERCSPFSDPPVRRTLRAPRRRPWALCASTRADRSPAAVPAARSLLSEVGAALGAGGLTVRPRA